MIGKKIEFYLTYRVFKDHFTPNTDYSYLAIASLRRRVTKGPYLFYVMSALYNEQASFITFL